MQHYFFIVLAMPLVASGNGMFTLDHLVEAHAEAIAHADSSLKEDIDADHERVKLMLVQVEQTHAEHVVAHEDAQAALDQLESQHGLADLKYFVEKDRLALQATNEANREEVKQELARLAAVHASNGSSTGTQMSQEVALERELARLDARHNVFESFAAQLKATAAKESACARARDHLTKLGELQKKAATAPKSMRGTTAKVMLYKDPAFIEAMAEDITSDTNDGHVHLAQTRATIMLGRKRVHGGGNWNFPIVAAIGAFVVTYLTVSQATHSQFPMSLEHLHSKLA